MGMFVILLVCALVVVGAPHTSCDRKSSNTRDVKRSAEKGFSVYEQKKVMKKKRVNKFAKLTRVVVQMREELNGMKQKMDEDQKTLIDTIISLKHDMIKEVNELKQNMSADHQRLAVISITGCQPGYTSTTYGCHKAVWSEKVSWEKAKTRCEDDGAHLVSIESSEEAVALSAMMTSKVADNNYGYWTSGRKQGGVWKWTRNDSPFSYTDWGPGQPGGDFGDCVYMDYEPSNIVKHLTWWDNLCTSSRYYICEA